MEIQLLIPNEYLKKELSEDIHTSDYIEAIEEIKCIKEQFDEFNYENVKRYFDIWYTKRDYPENIEDLLEHWETQGIIKITY